MTKKIGGKMADNDPIEAGLLIVVSPSKGDEPPPSCRLKAWLKEGLRRHGIRAKWLPSNPKPTNESEDPNVKG
jgi:hypothetical protein